MSSLPEQTNPVYATDEDIAVRAGGDFITLCPGWQQMAYGTDGFFLPGLAVGAQFDRDQLRGEQRHRPTRSSGSRSPRASIPGSGVLLAIDSVLETSITLRRLHKDLNVGQPPAPPAA